MWLETGASWNAGRDVPPLYWTENPNAWYVLQLFSDDITCVFDRDVSVDGCLSVLGGRKCGDGALLQLPEPNQDKAV